MALHIRPIHPAFAGEVSGVDITRPISREDAVAIDTGMHRVTRFDETQVRDMRRTTVAGDEMTAAQSA
jgi:alpha-ketoglutarate-dependent 2,4-dichlorophenoxyacetate dioxygenase